MRTGTITIEITYDDKGDPTNASVGGEASGNGQIMAAAALIAACASQNNFTTRSILALLVNQLGGGLELDLDEEEQP